MVASPDGTRIAWWRSGSGEPLVLVHGTTADHRRWARALPLLLGSESPPIFAAATELLCATLPRSTRRLLPAQQHVAMETAPTLFADEFLRYVRERP